MECYFMVLAKLSHCQIDLLPQRENRSELINFQEALVTYDVQINFDSLYTDFI